jgi:hypothetical protein
MPANPRLAYLLASYAKFDTITLVLAGVALLFVLLGWLLHNKTFRVFRFQLSPFTFQLSFSLLFWILVLAGTAYLLLTGGPS